MPSPLIVVADYNTSWPRLFEELREPIWQVVATFALRIEHVGSTSVPGLAAKPSIDMDIVLRSATDVPQAIDAVSVLGYVHRGDLGISGREAFQRPPDSPPHNLYVCHEGSPALANHLAFRDHLRSRPDRAAEYAALKKRLASQFPDDVGSYVEGKTAFITSILRATGFREETLSEIEIANRRPT